VPALTWSTGAPPSASSSSSASGPRRQDRPASDCASGLEDPPGFSVDDNCLIRANRTVRNPAGQLELRDIPKSDVEGIRACRELVEAARRHEEHHRSECCKVSCQSGCSVSECKEVSRRQRCAQDPARDECRSAYASTKGVPPLAPSRDTIEDSIREEKKGYNIAIKSLRDELMAKQPKCTVADASSRRRRKTSSAARSCSRRRKGVQVRTRLLPLAVAVLLGASAARAAAPGGHPNSPAVATPNSRT